MASEPLSPSLSTSSRHRFPKHDTGFPEPFNGVSNTTLPHPDADLSPDAVISQEDINFTGFMRRSRRPFNRHKSKRTISHGRITATAAEAPFVDAVIEEEEDAADSATDGQIAGRSRSGSSINPSRPAGVLSVSTGRPSTSRDADSVFSANMGDVSPTTSTSSIKKKGGMFRKLRFLN